jgi:dTDP-4-dehydrorhamnose 3,5-epimerase
MKTTEYSVKQHEIPGLLEFDITLIEDPRGWFQEKFQRAKLLPLGLPEDFQVVQHNISFNKEVGVTRGFHLEPWDKYISVGAGKIHSVFVDLREENFGRAVEIPMDPTKAVFIPRGVANSFQTLEPNTYYLYLVNDHWSAEHTNKYKFVNLADPDLAIDWPVPLDQSIISEKDKAHPYLRDVTPFKT